MPFRRTIGMFAVLALTISASAQDAKPPEASVPAGFRAFIVTDTRFPPKNAGADPAKISNDDRDPRDRTKKMHCLICENGLSPVVAIFVRAAAGNLDGVEKLAKGVDALIPKYRADKLAGFVIFLNLEKEYQEDEKRDAFVEAVRDFATKVGAKSIPFGLAPTSSKAAQEFGIKADDEVTVIIYNRLRIIKRWTFKADGPNAEQVKEILDATEEMITGKKQ